MDLVAALPDPRAYPEMTMVRYWVEGEGVIGFRVRGEVQSTSPDLRLFAHQGCGDPEDFQGNFFDLTATCARSGKQLPVSNPRPREWQVDAAAGPLTFTYTVRLPLPPEDFSSYLQGWRGDGSAFFLGLALFLAVEDREAHYRIHFSEPTYASCPEKRGEFFCAGRRELFLSAFGQGTYRRRVAQSGKHRLVLIREETSPLQWEGLIPHLTTMLSHILDLFGQAPFRRLTFFLFAGKAGDETEMGSGLAIPGGVLLTFPCQSAPVYHPRHLWLALHEFLHQWLGMDLRAGEPGLEWFFEGFTCFFTLALLERGGWADPAYVGTVLERNRSAYLAAAQELVGSTPPPPRSAVEFDYHFHGGFFLARLWDRDLRQAHSGGLAAWMKEFYMGYRGRCFDAASLLAALKATAPGGRLPDYFPAFLNREQLLPLEQAATSREEGD